MIGGEVRFALATVDDNGVDMPSLRGLQFDVGGEGRATQTNDADLQAAVTPLAEKLTAGEKQIVAELIAVQGKPADIGGYYKPDDAKASAALRPSATLNAALATL
jgi:monomeric isocitrate dehydrogenase